MLNFKVAQASSLVLDACRITRGRLFLDKAHNEEIARFALAYRALPKEKFETVGTKTDPVAVRTLVCDNKRYVYAVNRDYYPIEVEISLDRSPESLIDLSTGKNMRSENLLRLALAPYELRSFSMSPEIKIIGFVATPPESIASALLENAKGALSDIQALSDSGYFIPGMEQMGQDIKSAMAEGRLAWLRRALSGYIIRKCRDLLKSEE